MYLKTQIENLLRLAKEQESYEPYKEVLEKITLTGAEYFDLGYKVSDFEIGDTIRFEGIVKGTEASSIPSSGSQLMFSIGNDGGQWLGKAQNGTKYAFGSSNVSTISFNEEVLADVTIALSGSASRPTFTISGSVTSDTTTSTITQRSATPTYYDFPLLFGAGTKSTGEKSYGGDYTIKCGKIYINGTMTKDYVPALDSQMRPCLYDKISKTFTYAKKISDGATAYDLGFKRWNKFEVDYIQSDGNQYIDTGYKFTNKSAFEITCAEVAAFEASTVLCGARNNTDTTTNTRIVDYSYSAPSVLRGEYLLLQRGGYDVNENVIYIPYDTEFHTYYQSPTRMSIDDTDRPTVPSLVSPNMNFYIFWQNVGTATAPAKAKIKAKNCKLWDNGTLLVRDYKPSVRTYNNGTGVVTKAFMYDEVYNKAYDNAGTGSFKAYITNISTTKTNVFTTTGATSGKAINAEGKIINSSASSYSALLPIVGGTVIDCVSGNTGNNNYRFHCYDSSGTWIEQSLVLYPEGAGTVEPITGSFTAPINAKYVRVSYATQASSTIQVKSVTETIYEVGKAIKYPQNNGFTLDAPNSSNFILDLLTRATTTGSYYILDTRNQTGSSSEEEFGIGGSSSGATVNWKCEAESQLVSTNGTNWTRTSNYTYSQLLVGYKEGNTFKRTASFYDFNNQRISDVTVVTATRDIANNTKPLTVLHTTSSNWLQNGADIHYFKYLQDDNDVWYDCIPVRNATLTSSVLLFDRANNTSLPNTGSGTPTFVALD